MMRANFRLIFFSFFFPEIEKEGPTTDIWSKITIPLNTDYITLSNYLCYFGPMNFAVLLYAWAHSGHHLVNELLSSIKE